MWDIKDLLVVVIGYLGRVRGATRIQKVVFLLINEAGLDVDVEFLPHLYGPWSPQICTALKELEKENVIEVRIEEVSVQDEAPPKIYMLSEKGKRIYDKLISTLDPLERLRIAYILSRYGHMPLTYLISYVYSKYPEYSILSRISDKVYRWRKAYGLR